MVIQDIRWAEDPTAFDGSSDGFGEDINGFTRTLLLVNKSTIDFRIGNQPIEETKKVVDALVTLVKSSPTIMTLKVAPARWFVQAIKVYMYLFVSLEKVDSLDSLWFVESLSDDGTTVALASYLERSRNLNCLAVRFPAVQSPTTTQLLSSIGRSNITQLSLCLDLKAGQLRDLGAILGRHCSSIRNIDINIRWPTNQYRNAEQYDADVERLIKDGIASMRSLTRLKVSFLRPTVSPLSIDAVRNAVLQHRGALEHVGIGFYNHAECCADKWRMFGSSLGSGLASVKSLSLRILSEEAWLVLLPHLQSCEALKLPAITPNFGLVGSSISRLPKLRTIIVTTESEFSPYPAGFKNDFVNMVRSSNTITKAIAPVLWGSHFSCLDNAEVESFCVLNRVFSTNLIGFDPTDLWARILARVSHDRVRETILFRLLCEKPELIHGSMHLSC